MGQENLMREYNLNYGRISSDPKRQYRVDVLVSDEPDFVVAAKSYAPSGFCIYCGRPESDRFDPSFVFIEPEGNKDLFVEDKRTDAEIAASMEAYKNSDAGTRARERNEKFTKEFPQKKFSEEHIIAEGLGGKHILPEASCVKCAEITSRIEMSPLRGFLNFARSHFGAVGRRPKQRPSELPVYISSDFSVPYAMKAISEHPFTFATIDFGPPKFLTGEEPGEFGSMRVVTIDFQPDLDARLEKIPAPSGGQAIVSMGEIEYQSFQRMLAKIAHGYATLVLGYGNFTPLLVRIILDESDIDLSYYIGGAGYRGITKEMHCCRLFQIVVDNQRYVLCDVQIFSHIGTPVYRVVVGKINIECELPMREIGKNGIERFPDSATITEIYRSSDGRWVAAGQAMRGRVYVGDAADKYLADRDVNT